MDNELRRVEIGDRAALFEAMEELTPEIHIRWVIATAQGIPFRMFDPPIRFRWPWLDYYAVAAERSFSMISVE